PPPAHHRTLHPFPTRRSSDLTRKRGTRPKCWRGGRLRELIWQTPVIDLPNHLQGTIGLRGARHKKADPWSATTSPMTPRWEPSRSEEHTSELQSPCNLVCRLL